MEVKQGEVVEAQAFHALLGGTSNPRPVEGTALLGVDLGSQQHTVGDATELANHRAQALLGEAVAV